MKLLAFVRRQFTIPGLVASLLWVGLAHAWLFLGDWGSNPIITPPGLMLLPGSTIFLLLVIPYLACGVASGELQNRCFDPEVNYGTKEEMCAQAANATRVCMEKFIPEGVPGYLFPALMVAANVIVFWFVFSVAWKFIRAGSQPKVK